MDSENRFWLSFWGILVAGIAIITLIGAAYHKGKNEQILKATTCFQIAALSGNNHTLTLCGLTQRKKDEQ